MSKCPGISNKDAGKADGCEGCPNQSYCSKEKLPDKYKDLIKTNLGDKIIIAVMSGKGGVGKSTTTYNLAHQISSYISTCIVDLDICGPSIPKLTQTESFIRKSETIDPVKLHKDLFAVSYGHIDKVEVLDSSMKTDVVKQILSKTVFDHVGCIVVDLPPNVSDEHLALVNYVNVNSVVLVTTPQEIALNDVRRQIDFCRKAGFDIYGVIENMSSFTCKCGENVKIFSGDVRSFCVKECVNYLGNIEIDKNFAKKCDLGDVIEHDVFKKVAKEIVVRFSKEEGLFNSK